MTHIDTDTGVNLPTKIELRAVAELLPYARNSKRHSPAQVTMLAGMIRRFGWTNPCLVADGGLLAGHGRIMAAKQLGLARVPCIDLSHLSPEDRRAVVIADNRSAEVGASWDLEMLKAETDDLREAGFDLEATIGFAEEDLAAMFADLDPDDTDSEGGDPDATPELPDQPISQAGDVWVCGPHRVACGDSTDPATWQALLQGERVDVVVTDPPYGVDLERKNRLMDKTLGGERSKTGEIRGDKLTGAALAELLAPAFANLFDAMKPGATIYVAHPDAEAGTFRAEFDRAGFKFSQNVIWKKNNVVLGPARYLPIHEPIIVGRRPGSKSAWYGGRKQKTVLDMGEGSPFQQTEDGRWTIRVGDQVLVVSGDAQVEELEGSMLSVAKPTKSGLHPSQKPVELIERLLRNSARRGDLVADAFGGSGATLVAADRLGMSARLVELDEAFCDVIIRRWEQYTGRRAVHARTGREFPRAGEQPQEQDQDTTTFLSNPALEGQDVF